MDSSIPFISIVSLLRIVLSTALLLPLLDCHEPEESESSASATSAFSAEMPSSAHDFVNSIGLNTHLNYYDRTYGNFPLVERELRSLGVLHLRDGIHLEGPGYDAALYGRWISLGKLGIRFDAVLDPRNNLGPINSTLLEQLDTVAGHTIESFEGPNEMDASNESNWPAVDREFQTELFNADKPLAAESPIRVIGPSLAFASASSMIGNLSSDMDFGNLHPYPAGKMPSSVFPDQVNLEKTICDNRPIIFTESGYHNAVNEQNNQPGVSEAAAAKYILRLFLEDFARGIPRTYLYELLDEAPEPGLANPQLHWGLIRADGTEKPAFFALKNLIAELSDPSAPSHLSQLDWMMSPHPAQVHHLLLEKSDGTYDLVLWQELPSYDIRRHSDVMNADVKVTLTLGRTARSLNAYEPVFQEDALHSWSDARSVSLEISDDPVVVEITF